MGEAKLVPVYEKTGEGKTKITWKTVIVEDEEGDLDED